MATLTAVGGLYQPVNNQETNAWDYSQAYGLYDQSQGSRVGGTVTLANATGNTLNMVDPGAIIAGQNVALAGINSNLLGLNRITDSATLAVDRALQLAGQVQGGQGDQIVRVLKYAAIALGVAWVFGGFGGKKGTNAH